MPTSANIDRKQRFDFIFSLLLAYSLLGFVTGGIVFSDDGSVTLGAGGVWKAALAFAAMLLFWFNFFLSSCAKQGWTISERFDFRLGLNPVPFVLTLIALILSDFPGRSYVFYNGADAAMLVLYGGVVATILWTLCAGPKLSSKFLAPLALFGFQLFIAAAFLDVTHDKMIFGDDHPSFLYRLQLLRETFPNIPFYNTEWNGGYWTREFFPVGVLSVFFLASPLIYLTPDFSHIGGASVYTWIICYLFIFVIPWSVYFAARLLDINRLGAFIAGLLAFGPSLGYFEYLLKYGTIGFLLSAGILPFALALGIRVCLLRTASRTLAVTFVLFATICVLWPLASIFFLPFGISVLLAGPSIWKQPGRKALLSLVALCAINLPWMIYYATDSNILHFLEKDKLPGTAAVDARPNFTAQPNFIAQPDSTLEEEPSPVIANAAIGSRGYSKELLLTKLSKTQKQFKEVVSKLNPLLLFLFLPGLYLIPNKTTRAVLGWTLLWVMFLSALGSNFKPQLELKRMAIPGAFLMCVFVGQMIALALGRLTELKTNPAVTSSLVRIGVGVFAVFILGSVLLSPYTVAAAYSNRTIEKHRPLPDIVVSLSRAIAKHGGNGRTVFLGFILHELGSSDISAQDGGHIAPLASFSGKPLYASYFTHRHWKAIDPIPESFRARGREGIEEFLDLINASAVITFRREWADYAMEGQNYKEVFHEGRFRLYTRSSAATGYVLKGSAKVTAERTRIYVQPESEEVVLKYRYIPKLKLEPEGTAELFPVSMFKDDLGESVEFIGIRAKNGAANLPKQLTIFR